MSLKPLMTSHSRATQATSLAGSFFDQVAEGIQERDRKMMARQVKRYTGYAAAVLSCLSAGSITAYSLYAPLFQSHLRYTQFQVNIVSITAELAMYLPVPIFGYICDRYGPGIASLMSAFMFGVGYLLAAFSYHSGPDGWPFGVMVLAYVPIGMGTSAMYFSALTTCVKNFGRGKNKGLALAIPVASFGLSGMWQSQVGSRLLFERKSDGSRGDVDVFRFFIFLAILLFLVGMLGSVALRIVDEEEMIDEAVDELERSGLLQHDEFFTRAAENHGYGTMAPQDLSDSAFSLIRSEAEQLKTRAAEEARKKTWLLNEETRRFLADHTMWWLAAGFFLVTGPGEAFINNLGTIIGTLYPPSMQEETSNPPTTPATHVSIVAITSTLARLLTGTLSDLLAPTAPSHQYHRAPHSSSSSLSSLSLYDEPRRFAISRIAFLILFSLLLFAGQVLLASGFIQNHGERFWAVSALIGAGYGAVFSLVPIVISVVWGVENFGTNWGIVAMMPAAGAAVWGLVYSTVYDAGREGNPETGDGVMCYGVRCYAPTFWAMAVSVWIACGLWIWAWRGPGGWRKRGVAV
ncbi:MFS monocarboxylic acid transporter-like protein [Saccharata proteae CBS 121410]|uniref:Probable transporter MCH1 n=1 Tax=Saccharata proteae CBS 121410 TaxID=1314787 RepID=A0A9P4LT20_9PEZI|nr:MFS monocarboxylic acid transporter-like protein [Saccharata proteae CBS 121410]